MATANSAIKKIAAGYQNAVNLANYEAQMEQYYADIAQYQINKDYKDAIAQQEYEYQNQQIELANQAQLDAYDKSVKIYENNLQSLQHYADTQADRIQLGLDEKIAEIGFQMDDLDLAFQKNVMEAAYGTAAQDQIIKTATDRQTFELNKIGTQSAQLDSQIQQVNLNKQISNQQDEQIANNEKINKENINQISIDKQNKDEELSIQKRATDQLIEDKEKADNDKNYAFLQAQVEEIQQTGAARARGVKGQSAQKQLNALQATVSFNMSKMVDDLYFSKSALERKRKDSMSQEDIIGNLKGRLDTDISIKNIENANLGKDIQINEIKRKLLDQDKSQLTIQQTGLKDDQGLVKLAASDTTQTAQRNIDKIAELLGLDQKELELDQDKLAEQLLSEAEASKIALQEVETKLFEAENKAYEQLMLAPKLQPLLPVPYETPDQIFVMPQEPIEFPKEAAGQGVGGNAGIKPPSTVSSVLGIASTIAGIAAPFTGGASLAVGAAAGGLGFLSSIFK